MYSLVVLLLAVGVTVSTSSPVVPSQCADPTFACQDLESARACNVVKSCIHDIWATMNAPEDNDEICDICKEMVKEARDQLLSNMTQEEIKEVFEGSCKLLPVKLIADACIKVVDEIIPQLVEMLASRMDPNMVCTVSGLCNMAHLPIEKHVFKFMKSSLKGDQQCSDCTTLMGDVKTFLTESTEAEVKTYIDNACKTKLPSYLCKIVMNEYFHEIYQYIQATDAVTMCTTAGVCPKTSEIKSSEPKIKDELTCEFCEHVLEHIKELITANTTAEEFKTALLNFCKMTGKYSDKCTALVNDYYDMLFNYIRSLDSKGMCTLMGLCGGSVKMPLIKIIPAKEHLKRIPLIRLQPAVRISNEIDPFQPLVELIPASLQNKKPIKQSNNAFQSNESPFCDICKEAMEEVEKQLQDPATKQQLENFLGQGCNVLPKSLRDDCVNFVNQNVDALIDILQQELQPNNICPAIGLCPASQKITLHPRVKDLECDVCKDVVSSFRQKLEDPKNKVIIQTFLEEGCIHLPSSLATECKQFVDENIDVVITILVEEMDPAKVCSILKICPALLEVTQKTFVNDLECDLCKQVVEQVEKMIQDKKTEDEIRSALDKVCSYLPSKISAKCQNFVNQYTDLLITLIAEELDPQMVCAAMKICPKKNIECSACQDAFHYLQEMLMTPSTQEEVKNVLKQMCSVLPEAYSTNCEAFFDEYGSSLLTLVAQEIDPGKMCFQLQLCPNATSHFAHTMNRIAKWHLDECSVCTTIVDYLDKMLEEDDVDKEITQLVEKVCVVIPASYKDKCKTTLEAYGPYILQMIGQMADSKQVCQEIDLCSRSPHQVHLIGGSKCTFGPSYWCQSKTHAASCKAESFCKTHVW